ncbi:hypothetical protein SAMN05428997_111114 [Bosea sp. CRIB-10]|uniref:hypothetical protein n=1 Tax=Bosea sp. CRIB-10 TaxID=378404 RepID=UPI0008E84B11|nr:hypothetical protein [Bosea sp. CRIB-10]SFC77998.1 hypothetical protein SAMN05428997_111114 [Bosea sp. CRIB-10]
MMLLDALRAAFAAWFERAVPAELSEPRWLERSLTELGAEERRRSIREVTLEQLGNAHWSCHTHF